MSELYCSLKRPTPENKSYVSSLVNSGEHGENGSFKRQVNRFTKPFGDGEDE